MCYWLPLKNLFTLDWAPNSAFASLFFLKTRLIFLHKINFICVTGQFSILKLSKRDILPSGKHDSFTLNFMQICITRLRLLNFVIVFKALNSPDNFFVIQSSSLGFLRIVSSFRIKKGALCCICARIPVCFIVWIQWVLSLGSGFASMVNYF